MSNQRMSCVERALACMGNGRRIQAGAQSELARRMKVTRQQVCVWKRRGYFPPQYAADVELVTNGEVTAAEVAIESRDYLKAASSRRMELVQGGQG